MKIEKSAKCPYCKNDLGTPTQVIRNEKKDYTLYLCNSCPGEWHRPHY